MLYIFFDESGDLGLDTTKQGTTRHFLITGVITPSKRTIDKIVSKTHRELQKKYHKHGNVLHAYKEKPITRKRLLHRLSQKDCRIVTISIDKIQLYSNMHSEQFALYADMVSQLLKHCMIQQGVLQQHSIELIASQRETNVFYNRYFHQTIIGLLSQYHSDFSLHLKNPSEEKGLQAVDFLSWAIFRKYEYDDDTYYRIIQSNIVAELEYR